MPQQITFVMRPTFFGTLAKPIADLTAQALNMELRANSFIKTRNTFSARVARHEAGEVWNDLAGHTAVAVGRMGRLAIS